MNFHQVCNIIAMDIIPAGSTFKGKKVTGLFIVPKSTDRLNELFLNWQRGEFPHEAYQQYYDLDILVVLDNSLAHSISIWDVLGT